MSEFKPYQLTISVFGMILLYFWLATSGMSYQSDGLSLLAYKTAGWFVLGLPVFGFVAVFFTLIAVLIHRVSAAFSWGLSLLLLAPLLYSSVISTLPIARLEGVLKIDSSSIKLLELRQMDSFNGGRNTTAVIEGDQNLYDTICHENNLTPAPETFPFWKGLSYDLPPLHASITTHGSEHLTCYHAKEANIIIINHSDYSDKPDETTIPEAGSNAG
jgi:hypothetical protein